MMHIIREIEADGKAEALLDPVSVRTGIERAHLEIALAVELYGSFGKAALALNMLPKTVNKRVRDLEFQLGCAIFERHKRRLVPTRSGRVFLRRISQLLQDFHTLVEAVRRIADGKAGQIAIGYHGSVAHGDLHHLLFQPDPLHPDIHHLPIELSHDRLFESLASGRIDLAIVRGSPADFHGLNAPLWNERIILCLPETHKLADCSLLQWPDLAGETFLVSGYGPIDAIRQLLEDRLAPLEVSPRMVIHDIGTSAIIQMVRAGHGVCLCLEPMMVDHYAGTVFRELSGATGPEYVTNFACWHADSPNPALKRLLIRLRRQYGGKVNIDPCVIKMP
ncbi:LysR:LysR substrate-binding regulatory protein [Sphingobium yanoikuyae]|uniref:LysR:LysR substrate-binding regulatory protein n=1 Tax=Sphingobium yanoikuyae TaxID=13690 RepID=A0A084ENB5_SPHYA|nr:LysR family transcriptional regulator [Sphingobium yanoikuyae]KEZ19457.1 LysR:LysR substrate-binding regulatory protein [Sphingobium yanoikuyae]